MSRDSFESWFDSQKDIWPSQWHAAQAAWHAAQEQPAAPALLTIGRSCVMCGHMNVWDVEQAAPSAPAAIQAAIDVLLHVEDCLLKDAPDEIQASKVERAIAVLREQAAPRAPKYDASDIVLLAAAASTGAPGAITLAAQITGQQPCEKCGYVAHSCKCHPQPEKPAPSAPLSDEQIEDCYDAAKRSYIAERGGVRGQMCLPSDNFNWHFARAIEAAHGIGKGEA
jgi:hypothetical protein